MLCPRQHSPAALERMSDQAQFAQIQFGAGGGGGCVCAQSSLQPAMQASFMSSNHQFVSPLSLALSLSEGAKILINTKG